MSLKKNSLKPLIKFYFRIKAKNFRFPGITQQVFLTSEFGARIIGSDSICRQPAFAVKGLNFCFSKGAVIDTDFINEAIKRPVVCIGIMAVSANIQVK